MMRLLFLLWIVSRVSAFSPGLTIPKWYQGNLKALSTPELGRNFQLQFEFQPLLKPLSQAEIELTLPTGLKALKGSLITSVSTLPTGTSVKLLWTLRAEQTILGRLISIQVKTPYPKDALKGECLQLYGHEPVHQRNQLLKHLQNMREQAKLSFHLNLMILETEGMLKVHGLVFKNKVQIEGHKHPFLTYNPDSSSPPANKSRKQEISNFEKVFAPDLLEPSLNTTPNLKPTPGFQKALQRVSFLYYQVALEDFYKGNYDSADQGLQKLSRQLLREPEMNYGLFIAIQNLRALSLTALDKIERAKQIWITTLRTAADSALRHYLMYNLAILFDTMRNPALKLHYLNEAMKSQPGFTLARILRDQLFQN
jgi:hypothetical protein